MRLYLRTLLTLVTLCCFITPFDALAEKAPQFSLQGDSKKIQLANYKGRVVYVDFWASWCEPCRRSFSWMNKMQSLYGKEKFSIIAINLDDSRAAANEFLQKIPASFQIAYDPSGKTAEAYQLKAMPSSFLINARGELVYRHVGFHNESKDELENQIRQQLGKSMLASSQEK